MTLPLGSSYFLSAILPIVFSDRRRFLFGLVGAGLFFIGTWGLKETLIQVLPPLPRYTLILQTGGSDLCCDEATATQKPPHLRSDEILDIVLRPERAPAGPVFVHVYTRHGAAVRTLHCFLDQESDGRLRLRGMARDLLDLDRDASGPYELLFAINRSPLPLDFAQAQSAAAHDPNGSRLQLVRGVVIISAVDP